MNEKSADWKRPAALALGALGVVFGDIGTSPLYAIKECFHHVHGAPVTPANILGVLSLFLWSLIVIVCYKYLLVVMRLGNKGEGGVIALLALLPSRQHQSTRLPWLLGLGMFGAALIYGDGMITPAITVLSAMEGLEVATPAFKPFVLPLSLGVLVGIFSLQKHGTARIGAVFGPAMLLWFGTLAALGVKGILAAPEVLAAVNPWPGLNFLLHNGALGFVVMGAVFLCVTGSEALYADMGHFGIGPIRLAWFTVAFPALLLNYFGQGALLLHHPELVKNPFYHLAPEWALLPLVGLAAMASVIASQALITGAFSLTMQAIQLGLLPRMSIKHTSEEERGQIYLPFVNWALMVACLGLVAGFRTSSNLAAAYGIAVSLTMVITSVLFYPTARLRWRWPAWKAGLACGTFLILEAVFLASNSLKITHGGWFPLLIGAGLFALMATWRLGRRIIGTRLAQSLVPWELFLDDLRQNPPHRIKGTSVFLAGNPAGVPIALLHNLKHNRVLHERVVILHIATSDEPRVEPEERVSLEPIGAGFTRVTGRFGYMEEPNIEIVLRNTLLDGLRLHAHEVTFFLSRETIVPSKIPGMARWRVQLFSFLARNAQSATAFFGLPPNRVIELGMQVQL